MRRWITTGLVFLLPIQPAFALSAWTGESGSGDLRGLVRLMGSVLDYPVPTGLEQDDDQAGLLGRLVLQHTAGSLTLELNGYQTWLPLSLQLGAVTGALDVERSARLEWETSRARYAHLGLDRLSARWSLGWLDLSLGRQPINLATTFFFSPNDLFAPFSAQTFYRVYKPGVDAVRAEVQLSELTQLSLLGVLGYRPDPDSITGWSETVDSDRHSTLARITGNFAGLEWGMLTGKVRRERVHGVSLQGELFGRLGLRAEGQQAVSLDGSRPRYTEWSISIEHRWESSLMLQLEQYYHGRGAQTVAEYDPLNNRSGYLARRYQALGVSYEFSPLLNGQFSVLRNHVDHARLFNGNLIYSLSDESELSVSFTLAEGKAPQGMTLQSEYGTLPQLFSLEWRSYF
ncbi:MAG: hypothetical protein OEZ39_15890 [Gammaproteobacteria bacterium]|nr:hypothetical protein [Gammaproteobacteria bacterium]MDH5653339.1 hypothetical protein [Gammaproteobacteria bacterium]